jgi:hypothetical protein
MSPPKLRWYEYGVALLPFALGVASLAALEFGVGGAGAAVNLRVMQTSLPRCCKVASCLGVTFGSMLLCLALGILMR